MHKTNKTLLKWLLVAKAIGISKLKLKFINKIKEKKEKKIV